MNNAEEIRKSMFSTDTKEVAKILESLDENSVVLARTYMTALSDRKKIEEAKLTAAVWKGGGERMGRKQTEFRREVREMPLKIVGTASVNTEQCMNKEITNKRKIKRGVTKFEMLNSHTVILLSYVLGCCSSL